MQKYCRSFHQHVRIKTSGQFIRVADVAQSVNQNRLSLFSLLGLYHQQISKQIFSPPGNLFYALKSWFALWDRPSAIWFQLHRILFYSCYLQNNYTLDDDDSNETESNHNSPFVKIIRYGKKPPLMWLVQLLLDDRHYYTWRVTKTRTSSFCFKSEKCRMIGNRTFELIMKAERAILYRSSHPPEKLSGNKL